MPKLKSKRAAVKRFRQTGNGKIKAQHAKGRHILEHKKPGSRRRNGGNFSLRPQDAKLLTKVLPYGLPK